jgi:Ala-tRNA(Pro) deacylase
VKQIELYQFFKKHNIDYTEIQHAPVYTVEQAQRLIPQLPANGTKNLFLRNKNGKRHVLLVVDNRKRINLKKFAAEQGFNNLSLASEQRLGKYLGVEAGAVSILGLINDSDHAVEVYVDKDLWSADALACHPLRNDKTVVIKVSDIQRFLSILGYNVRVIIIPEE